MRSGSDPRVHNCTGTNPYAIFQGYWLDYQIKGAFLIIVIAGEQRCALRNTGIWTNGDHYQAIEPNIFTDPRIVAYSEVPRIFNVYIRFNRDIATNSGAKNP